MYFVRYPHLILLISGGTFEFTVVLKNFWELNKISILSHRLIMPTSNELDQPAAAPPLLLLHASAHFSFVSIFIYINIHVLPLFVHIYLYMPNSIDSSIYSTYIHILYTSDHINRTQIIKFKQKYIAKWNQTNSLSARHRALHSFWTWLQERYATHAIQTHEVIVE